MTREPCRIITLPKIADPRGNLTFIEGENHIPFNMNRAYWIYDVPGGEKRGGHAYRTNSELINFSTNSLCLVLAATDYDESDYLRNFSDYCTLVEG